jgi:hypothetical protein
MKLERVSMKLPSASGESIRSRGATRPKPK